MLENRPIVSIAIGYILGIIMGLYCKISIVFLYLIILSVYPLFQRKHKNKFKIISFRRYFRYIKLIFTKKVIIIIILSSIISNTITIYQNYKYKNLYNNIEDAIIIATIVSNPKEKDFKNVYKIKVESINSNKRFENTYLYLKVKKNVELLKYGSRIKIFGEFEEPTTRRNYNGFDYKEYLKTLKIYGTVNCNNIEKLESKFNLKLSILKKSNNIFLKIKDYLQSKFNKDTSNVLLGLILGYTDDMDEEVKLDFTKSNMSHILAVSGMHVGFLVFGIKLILEKIAGKRKNKIITVTVLIIYMFITGFSPSVVRACIMAELSLFSYIFYRRNDIWQNLSLAIIILLIYNPFLIKSVSVLLTFAGTIGILIKPKKLKGIFGVSISVMFVLIPILALIFNQIPILGVIIGCISGVLVGPTIILTGLHMLLTFIVGREIIIKNIIILFTNSILKLAEFGSILPLNKIYVAIPNVILIILYYVLLAMRLIFKIYL